MIRILVADDHAIVRHGLRALFDAERDLNVVGEVADGPAALRAARELSPEVLVLDIALPGLSGLEVARQLARVGHRTRVLVLSVHAAEPYVLEALRNGVVGYALKDTPTQELLRAVREVALGRRYLSPALSERAITAYVARTATHTGQDLFETLTLREREVFHLAVHGKSNAAVGSDLSISPRTVETHRANFMRKLGLQSQTDLIRYALRRGIIPPDT